MYNTVQSYAHTGTVQKLGGMMAAGIIDFDRIRVGSEYPICLDIESIHGHESGGILAAFYTYEMSDGLKRVELRRREERIALFLFRYEDMDLPEWWQNSELLWSLAGQRALAGINTGNGHGVSD